MSQSLTTFLFSSVNLQICTGSIQQAVVAPSGPRHKRPDLLSSSALPYPPQFLSCNGRSDEEKEKAVAAAAAHALARRTGFDYLRLCVLPTAPLREVAKH